MELRYSFSLRLCREEKFFGPGVAQLLQKIDTLGSLRKAAGDINMAYSKAWKILKNAEKGLGFPLLINHTGGLGGGGASLTPACRDFLERYLRFEQECRTAVDEKFGTFFEKELSGR